jgi:hypothetical protein
MDTSVDGFGILAICLTVMFAMALLFFVYMVTRHGLEGLMIAGTVITNVLTAIGSILNARSSLRRADDTEPQRGETGSDDKRPS